jgi:hypothetical protein
VSAYRPHHQSDHGVRTIANVVLGLLAAVSIYYAGTLPRTPPRSSCASATAIGNAAGALSLVCASDHQVRTDLAAVTLQLCRHRVIEDWLKRIALRDTPSCRIRSSFFRRLQSGYAARTFH